METIEKQVDKYRDVLDKMVKKLPAGSADIQDRDKRIKKQSHYKIGQALEESSKELSTDMPLHHVLLNSGEFHTTDIVYFFIRHKKTTRTPQNNHIQSPLPTISICLPTYIHIVRRVKAEKDKSPQYTAKTHYNKNNNGNREGKTTITKKSTKLLSNKSKLTQSLPSIYMAIKIDYRLRGWSERAS